MSVKNLWLIYSVVKDSMLRLGTRHRCLLSQLLVNIYTEDRSFMLYGAVGMKGGILLP